MRRSVDVLVVAAVALLLAACSLQRLIYSNVAVAYNT